MIITILYHDTKFVCLLFILVLISIMTVPVSGTIDTNEEVMVIRTSGNIGVDERIRYNDYTIKVHEIHNDMVSLAVYKYDKFKEIYDFYEDEARQYEDFQVEVLRIEGSRALIAISTADTASVWSQRKTAHAFWGDYLTRDEYGIEVLSFENDSVDLAIYKYDSKLTYDTFYTGTVYKYLDDFMIYVTNVDKGGYVDILFYKRHPLDITGCVKTEKEVYEPGEYIHCEVEITNNAKMPINLADIVLTTQPAVDIVIPMQQVTDIKHDQSYVFEFLLEPSQKNENMNLNINAHVMLVDYVRRKYTYTFEKNVYISSNVGIIKEVIPSEVELQDDSGIAQSAALVQLTVFNVGTASKNIVVNDTIPEGINLYNSSLLEWNRSIMPGGVINITYSITPDSPGEYLLPPCGVSFNNTVMQSAAVPFTVHGPVIYINKAAHLIGDTVYVSGYVENVGDRAAQVLVSENIPYNCSLIEGKVLWDDIMKPGNSGQMEYSITHYEGLEILQGASVQYQDVTGNIWYFESEPVEITIEVFKPDVGRVSMVLFLLSSYFIIFILVVGIVALIGTSVNTYGGKYFKEEHAEIEDNG